MKRKNLKQKCKIITKRKSSRIFWNTLWKAIFQNISNPHLYFNVIYTYITWKGTVSESMINNYNSNWWKKNSYFTRAVHTWIEVWIKRITIIILFSVIRTAYKMIVRFTLAQWKFKNKFKREGKFLVSTTYI